MPTNYATCQVQYRDKVGWYLLWEDGFTSAMPDERTARLLAAAPGLLAACERALKVTSKEDAIPIEVDRELRAAIAESKGLI